MRLPLVKCYSGPQYWSVGVIAHPAYWIAAGGLAVIFWGIA